ncbi:hypothetical protein B0H11DRAFT_1617356, partial [Mycena galericulata]
RQMNNKPQSKCLRKNHGVTTVGQGFIVLHRLDSADHSTDAECECTACTDDRMNGCKHPHKCAIAIRDRLSQILPKWDPRTPEITHPDEAGANSNEEEFRPPTEISNLSEGFRIFTKNRDKDPPGEQPPPNPQYIPGEEMIDVAISGHIERAGLADAQCGAGIWYSHDDNRNASIKLPRPIAAN